MPGPSAVKDPKAVWEAEVTNKQGGELGTIVRIFTYVSLLQRQCSEKQDSSESGLQSIHLLPQNVLTKIFTGTCLIFGGRFSSP